MKSRRSFFYLATHAAIVEDGQYRASEIIDEGWRNVFRRPHGVFWRELYDFIIENEISREDYAKFAACYAMVGIDARHQSRHMRLMKAPAMPASIAWMIL